MHRLLIPVLSLITLAVSSSPARAQEMPPPHSSIAPVRASLSGPIDPRLLVSREDRAGASREGPDWDIYAMDPYMTVGGIAGAVLGLVVGMAASSDDGLAAMAMAPIYLGGGMLAGMAIGAGVYFLVES